MNKFCELGNRYAEKSNWMDFALVKFCLCAMGIIIGVNIPDKHKGKTQGIAGGIFAITYVFLMSKVFGIIKELREE